MEMVKTKIIALSFAAALAVSACSEPQRFTWKKYSMDGSRTGVTAPNASNVKEALGEINDSLYTAPNGRIFAKGSSTYSVAADMIAVQPRMAALKQVIGYSTREMRRMGPNCELSNWIVDHLMTSVEELTHRKVDVGIINSGGIRVDMPQGEVIMDDIVSMLPFKNHLCYVGLKGSDLISLFEKMAATSVQPVGGVKLVVTDHKIDTLLVGGKPVDPEKTYGVGTIDFLLDGGDRINVGKNAQELIITDVKVMDSILPYAKSFAEQGKNIEYFTDDRVVINGRERR